MIDLSGLKRMALLLKSSGMLYFLDLERQGWTSAFDATHEVELLQSLKVLLWFDFNLHKRPRYVYTNAWQRFVATRAKDDAAAAALSSTTRPSSWRLGARTDSSSVALIKATFASIGTPTTSTFGLSGTLLPGSVSAPSLA